jgi:hypothetical protein
MKARVRFSVISAGFETVGADELCLYLKSNIEYMIFPVITSCQLYLMTQFWIKYNTKQYGSPIKAVL